MVVAETLAGSCSKACLVQGTLGSYVTLAELRSQRSFSVSTPAVAAGSLQAPLPSHVLPKSCLQPWLGEVPRPLPSLAALGIALGPSQGLSPAAPAAGQGWRAQSHLCTHCRVWGRCCRAGFLTQPCIWINWNMYELFRLAE